MSTVRRTIVAPEGSQKLRKLVIEGHEVEETSEAHARALRQADVREKFVSISDRLAESTLYHKNWKYKEADEKFPHKPLYRTVDKYYPYAIKGPLLVDEPRSEHEMMRAYEKQKILKALGYRHVVIEDDTGFYECLEQLGET